MYIYSSQLYTWPLTLLIMWTLPFSVSSSVAKGNFLKSLYFIGKMLVIYWHRINYIWQFHAIKYTPYTCTRTFKHTHTSTYNHNIVVHFVIYWHIYWLSAVILEVCLVWLLLTVKYTFIHTVVLLLLLSHVLSFICIIIKIAIDWFYNREIKPLFRYLPIFLLYSF